MARVTKMCSDNEYKANSKRRNQKNSYRGDNVWNEPCRSLGCLRLLRDLIQQQEEVKRAFEDLLNDVDEIKEQLDASAEILKQQSLDKELAQRANGLNSPPRYSAEHLELADTGKMLQNYLVTLGLSAIGLISCVVGLHFFEATVFCHNEI